MDSTHPLTCALTMSRIAVRIGLLSSLSTSVEKMGAGVPARRCNSVRKGQAGYGRPHQCLNLCKYEQHQEQHSTCQMSSLQPKCRSQCLLHYPCLCKHLLCHESSSRPVYSSQCSAIAIASSPDMPDSRTSLGRTSSSC